jgi:ATP-binding cassette subfamily C protein CydD
MTPTTAPHRSEPSCARAYAIVASLPLLVAAMILAGLGAKAASERQWRTLTRLGGQMLDAVQGLDDIALFNAGARETANVRASADAYRRETMGVLRIAFLSSLALEFFATVAIAALALAIGFRLLWGQMDFRIGLFVLMVAPEVYAPIRALGSERHVGAAGRRFRRHAYNPRRPVEHPLRACQLRLSRRRLRAARSQL